MANTVTYNRMKEVMNDLLKYKGGPAFHLRDVLFGLASPSFVTKQQEFTPRNKDLNLSQLEAIQASLAANGTCMVT